MAEIHEYNGRRALLIQAVNGDEYWYYLDDPHRKSQATGEYISSSQKCANSKGLMWDNPPGIAYNWNGIPIRTNANDDIKSYIIAIYLIFGLSALPLNFLCAYFISKKESLSKSVKFLLLLDTFCRICESLFYIYKGTCVLSWHCVQTDGLSGILLNRIVIALSLGMVYSMELLLHSLSINRIFAVFFNGFYYERIQRFTIVHALFCFIAPIIYQLMQVGDLVEPGTNFHCYAGAFFSPSEFYVFIWFNINNFFDTIGYTVDYIVFGFLVFAMVLDVVTVLGIRLTVGFSKSFANNFAWMLDFEFILVSFDAQFYSVSNDNQNNQNERVDVEKKMRNLQLPTTKRQRRVFFVTILIKSPEAKKRADLRLAIMMLITGTIWIVETSFHYFVSWQFYQEFWYFFFYEAEPFLGHCVLSLVIIIFNLPQNPKKTRVRVLSICENSEIQKAYGTRRLTKASI